MAAKQRADTAGAFGLLDLRQNVLLELGGEMATLGLRHDFGIGIGAGRREGDGELQGFSFTSVSTFLLRKYF